MTPKIIVDAERHRRTPRTPAIDGKMFESKTSATLAQKAVEKTCQKHVNIMKKGAKMDAKSIKNHEKLRCAFLVRFGTSKRGAPPCRDRPFWLHFGSHFRPKVEKKHLKINA